MEQPPKALHAPKGDIALARAALLRFGESPGPAQEPDAADRYLTYAARQYNWLTLRGKPQRVGEALATVSNTAAAYANALRKLNEIAPGFFDFPALQRLPDGSTRPTFAGDVLLMPGQPPARDDLQIALAPELALPLDMRLENVLLPTVGRADAMRRLSTSYRKAFAGNRRAAARGNNNASRDGRTPKRMLVETCCLIVAGRFGLSGAAKIATTKESKTEPDGERKATALFVNFVRAMHIYASQTNPSERDFERSLGELAAIEAYLSEHAELYGFIDRRPGGNEVMRRRGAHLFMSFISDPAARPLSKSAS